MNAGKGKESRLLIGAKREDKRRETRGKSFSGLWARDGGGVAFPGDVRRGGSSGRHGAHARGQRQAVQKRRDFTRDARRQRGQTEAKNQRRWPKTAMNGGTPVSVNQGRRRLWEGWFCNYGRVQGVN